MSLFVKLSVLANFSEIMLPLYIKKLLIPLSRESPRKMVCVSKFLGDNASSAQKKTLIIPLSHEYSRKMVGVSEFLGYDALFCTKKH